MKGNQSKAPTVPGVYKITLLGGVTLFSSWRGYWTLTCGTPKTALVEPDRSEDLYHQNFTWVFEQPLAPLGKWKANIHHTMLNVFMDKVVWGLPLDPIGQFDTKALEQGLVGMYELAQPETAATSPTETRRPGLYSLTRLGTSKTYAVFLDGVWFAESSNRSVAIDIAKRGVLMADSVKKLSDATVLWNKSNMFNELVANRALKGSRSFVEPLPPREPPREVGVFAGLEVGYGGKKPEATRNWVTDLQKELKAPADTAPAQYITPEPLPGGELQMHEGVPHYYGVRKDRVNVVSECEFHTPGVFANITLEGHPHRHVLVLHNHTARHLSDAPLKMVHDADGTLGAVVVEGWLKIINANGDEKRVEPGIYRVAEFNIMCEKLARRSVQHWSL